MDASYLSRYAPLMGWKWGIYGTRMENPSDISHHLPIVFPSPSATISEGSRLVPRRAIRCGRKAREAMHILVVEDERRLARLLQEALEEESHVVELAFDGEQALELALDRTYDLIVLDIMLPGRDGLSV